MCIHLNLMIFTKIIRGFISTWYHLDHQLWTPQNLTIPVITATWILGLLAEPLMELLNKTMPWHKLLVPEPADESTENSGEISQ